MKTHTKIFFFLSLALFLSPTIASADVFGPNAEQWKIIREDFPRAQEKIQKLEIRQTWLIVGLVVSVIGVCGAYAVGFASGVKMRQSFTDEKRR